MAEDFEEPPAGGLARLDVLPQRFDVWQVDARPAAAALQADDRMVRPWMTVVVSATDGEVVAFELWHAEPSAALVWQTLRKAMVEPTAGEPHRPTTVQVLRAAWADELRSWLQEANVQCEVVTEAGRLDEVFAGLARQLPGPGEAGLLDMPGVTPEAVGSFFDAAARFYEQAPWQRAGERPIRVEVAAFESGPWYAVILGQSGVSRGLVLYDQLETLLGVQQGGPSEEETARQAAGLTVVFGPKEDLVPADAAALAQHAWPVAGAEAYPSAYRIEPGLSMRPPLAWELRLLEGGLRGLPEFVRKKTRRLGPLALDVPTAGGELPVVLSWAVDDS